MMVLSHPNPTPIVQWCEYLGLEPTVIQHQELNLDLQQAITTTFTSGGDLKEHAEQWGELGNGCQVGFVFVGNLC